MSAADRTAAILAASRADTVCPSCREDVLADEACPNDRDVCTSCCECHVEDVADTLIAAVHAAGIASEVYGMGGGCRAVWINVTDAAGRYLYVSDGDAARPSTRRVCAHWLDDTGNNDDVELIDTGDARRFDLAAVIAVIVDAAKVARS